MEGTKLLRDASASWLRHGVEQSLRNLGLDYIDLYQVHWPDPHTPVEETAHVLDMLVQEGKIRLAHSVPQSRQQLYPDPEAGQTSSTAHAAWSTT